MCRSKSTPSSGQPSAANSRFTAPTALSATTTAIRGRSAVGTLLGGRPETWTARARSCRPLRRDLLRASGCTPAARCSGDPFRQRSPGWLVDPVEVVGPDQPAGWSAVLLGREDALVRVPLLFAFPRGGVVRVRQHAEVFPVDGAAVGGADGEVRKP